MNKITTGINDIQKHTNQDTFFMSGWDKEPTILNVSTTIIADAINNSENKQNKYFFMSENEELKNTFIEGILNVSNINICTNNMSIAPNGTSSIFLSILSIKEMFNISNVILISPTYFTNINVIKMLNMNLYNYQINIFSNDIIDFDRLKKEIINNNIELIIITDPLFGTGIPIEESNYLNIFNIAKEFGIWIIIDYIYGGMEWKKPTTIINRFIIESILEYPKIVVIESISKRLFLNGIKFAIIYSNKNIISAIEEISESFIGSFSYTQNELFKLIYSSSNISVVINQIEKNIEHIKMTFDSMKSTILGKDIFLSNCTSGYFTLMGIPIRQLNGLSDNKAAFAIIDKVNIFTIPHSRYLFKNKDYYFFRINISLDRTQLIQNINKLLNTYFD